MLLVPRLQDGERLEAAAGDGHCRSLIIDRQALFMAALGNLLSGPPLNCDVSVASDSDAALELLSSGAFDLIFCEVRTRPISGAQLPAELARLGIKARLVLLADGEDDKLLISALQCGAVGFFTKDTSFEELLDGVQAIRAGHYVVGQNLVQNTLDSLARSDHADSQSPAKRLSHSELDILTMIGRAQSINDIATARGISRKTVRNHLASIYKKLELRSRTEAILWAARMGLTAEAERSLD